MSTHNIHEALLVSTHNMFCGEIRKILCGYPLLSGTMSMPLLFSSVHSFYSHPSNDHIVFPL